MRWWLLFIKSITGESSPTLSADFWYTSSSSSLRVCGRSWLVPLLAVCLVEPSITSTQRTDGRAAIGTGVRVWEESTRFPRFRPSYVQNTRRIRLLNV